MDVGRIVEILGDPTSYSHTADDLTLHQTHISVVSLAGPWAYKVKKPVDRGFLDFTTLEKRRTYCEREVELNRRLAPDVYRGVVPLTREDGAVRVDGSGDVVEYAVKMRRLPPEATLLERLERGELTGDQVERVARRIAAFHRGAASGPEISRFGRWDVVAHNARENFTQSLPHVERTVSRDVLARTARLTEAELSERRGLIDERARSGVPRDTHGDLHLDHVYLLPDREPPRDIVVVDCIEFSDRLRYGDPVADLAFLYMDLAFRGRRALARRLARVYFREAEDTGGRELLPLYVAYRAHVRGKVEGMTVDDPDVAGDERRRAARESRAHWLLGLGQLAPPERRPALLLVGGLPATGKSTLARSLAHEANFRIVATDPTRKRLAGISPGEDAASSFGEGIYGREWTERTYAACLEDAGRLLYQGFRVIVDATFHDDSRRRRFLEAADRWGVPARFFRCRADPSVVRRRLEEREGDVSDAGLEVYREIAAAWDEASRRTAPRTVEIRTDVPVERSTGTALELLREAELAAPAEEGP